MIPTSFSNNLKHMNNIDIKDNVSRMSNNNLSVKSSLPMKSPVANLLNFNNEGELLEYFSDSDDSPTK